MLEQLILISASLVGMGDGKVEMPVSMVIEKLNDCFKKQFGNDLGKGGCSPLYSGNNVIGFEASINQDKINFDLDGYLVKEYEKPPLYASNASSLTPLKTLISKSGFVTTSCVSQISSLTNKPHQKSFGIWNPVSFESVEKDCAQIASMDLIYTYKMSGKGNPSTYTSYEKLLEALKKSQKYQDDLGTSLTDFRAGFNSVLSSSFQLTEGIYNATRPVVCAYSPESENLGHIAMKIGEAETKFLEIFKTKWDIVVSSKPNYYGVEPTGVNKNIENCFFGIQSNRRQATFVLSGC